MLNNKILLGMNLEEKAFWQHSDSYFILIFMLS